MLVFVLLFVSLLFLVCSVESTNPYSKHVRELKVKGDTYRYFDLPSFEDARLGV